MRSSTRTGLLIVGVVLAAIPGRAAISVNWLDTPTVLFTDTSTWYHPLDLNNDSIIDFMFGVGLSSVSVRNEASNRYLIYPDPPPNQGGAIEPIPSGFEIGPNSGNGNLDWIGDGYYDAFIICLSGSGGPVCVGRFPGQRAYMGVEFEIAGSPHYGWIDMYVGDLGPGAEIYGWGYETDPGVSIIAGAVPEPSTILLLAAGSIALLYRTKRRNR